MLLVDVWVASEVGDQFFRFYDGWGPERGRVVVKWYVIILELFKNRVWGREKHKNRQNMAQTCDIHGKLSFTPLFRAFLPKLGHFGHFRSKFEIFRFF